MAIFLALMTCFVLVPLGAFVVDVGMQRVARRDMQAIADTAALDTARALAAGTTGSAALSAIATSSAARNSGAVGSGLAMVAFPGYIAPAASFASDQSLGCGESAGSTVSNSSFSTTVPSGKTANAVLVTASSSVDFAIHGGSGGACRSSIARAQQVDCYQVDSYALGLATNDSVLRGLLGSSAALRVLSNQGIATANVSLVGIAGKLGVGTPQELLNLPNVTVGSLLTAAASVLNDKGDTASLALATQLLGLKTDLGPIAAYTAPLSQLIDVGQGGESALDAGVNVFSLVTGSVEIANGTNAIAVNDLAVNLGLANVSANLYIVAPGKQACNGGTATATQGHITITGDLGSCNRLLSVACAGITLTVNLANASAKQSPNWQCSTDKLTLNVFDQRLANIRLQADVKQYLLGILVHIASIDTGAPSAGPTKDYDLPLPSAYTTPVETSSGTLGLDLSSADVTLLGAVSIGPVLSLLSPLVTAVTDNLVPNLLAGLGLTVDGADLTALPYVSCASPTLVG